MKENWTILGKCVMNNGFELASGVPCSILKNEFGDLSSMYAMYGMDAYKLKYIPAVDEGVALGLVNGYTLSGKRALLITQNSAIGKVLDLFMSFNLPYDVPLLWVISMRGYTNDTEVHKKSFEVTSRWLADAWFSVHEDYNMEHAFEEFCTKQKPEFSVKHVAILRYDND